MMVPVRFLHCLTFLLLLCRKGSAGEQPETDVLVLVDGNNDCCAGSMNRVRRHAYDKDMRVVNVVWSNFKENWNSGTALDDSGKERFVKTGKEFLEKLPDGTNIYMIGHSWGGDSALRVVKAYEGSNVNFRLLALIDPVGTAGLRSALVHNNFVPSKVEYFYNRYQTNQPFPIDFTGNGKLSCYAKRCDQEEQSHHKNADGTSVRVSCEAHEVTCPGWRLPGCNFGGCWKGSNGTKMKRSGHSGLATDGYVEESLKDIIDELLAHPPAVMAVAIQASNGLWVAADSGALMANRDEVGDWERFEVIELSDGWYAFRTWNGNYVKAVGGGGGALDASATAIGPSESFRIIEHGDNKFSLQTVNGYYLSAEGGGGNEVVANRPEMLEWEIFEIRVL